MVVLHMQCPGHRQLQPVCFQTHVAWLIHGDGADGHPQVLHQLWREQCLSHNDSD
ncbi:hypothetical protein BDW62DRAFT_174493 [Aspergillus aurantiobrunneus]